MRPIMKCATLICETIISALMLLVSFHVTSLGFHDDQYGNFVAWIFLCVMSLAAAVAAVYLRSEFRAFRYYPVLAAIASICLFFPINHLALAKVFCVLVLALVAAETLLVRCNNESAEK